jgi:hypothetical protein
MQSYGTLRRVALLRTDFAEERSASIIRVTRRVNWDISSWGASVASYG